MLYDEARIRQSELTGDAHRVRVQSEVEQLRKLDRLQSSVSVVRARLGIPADFAA